MTPNSSLLTPHTDVVGAGYWGKKARNFHQLGVLKTICDGAQPIREEMSKTYSGTDFKQDLFGDRFQICPPHHHPDIQG